MPQTKSLLWVQVWGIFIAWNKKRTSQSWSPFSLGTSGDTELFEKPSNINDFRASEQKKYLVYPPTLGRLFWSSRPFLNVQNKCTDWGWKSLFFLFVLPVKKRTRVIYHPACQSGTEVDFFSENKTFLNLQKYVIYAMLHLTKRINCMWTLRIRLVQIRENRIWITHVWKTGHN